MNLTKWPRLLVVGKPVTPEQANEILVRTDTWEISTNDHIWRESVLDLVGMVADRWGWSIKESVVELRKNLGCLDLHYLHNHRIASCWYGGPHGWCDWEGCIGCSTYNLGKWPDSEDVTHDWIEIAKAFPYLVLSAQLVTDEGEGVPAIQWEIRDGEVTTNGNPTELLTEITEITSPAFLIPYGERGCQIPQLARAIRQVLEARGVPRKDGGDDSDN